MSALFALPHWAALGGLLLLVNVITYLAFWRDKAQSRHGGRRITESRLLTLAIIGGWPSAKLAQRRLRHKTRKQSFATMLNIIGLAWAGAIGLLVLGILFT